MAVNHGQWRRAGHGGAGLQPRYRAPQSTNSHGSMGRTLLASARAFNLNDKLRRCVLGNATA